MFFFFFLKSDSEGRKQTKYLENEETGKVVFFFFSRWINEMSRTTIFPAESEKNHFKK